MTPKAPRGDYFIFQLPKNALGATEPSLLEQYPKHAQMIGCVTAEWSQIEYPLTSLVGMTLGMPSRVIDGILYAIDSSGARLKALRAAIQAGVEPESLAEWQEWFDQAES